MNAVEFILVIIFHASCCIYRLFAFISEKVLFWFSCISILEIIKGKVRQEVQENIITFNNKVDTP